MTKATSESEPDLLTQVEAHQVLDASLDMLDALESLVLYQAQVGKDELSLDVWEQAIKAIKRAGGTVYT